MDARKLNKGTKGNKGGGRHTKEENQLIAEKLSPLDENAFNSLTEGLKDGQSWAVKLFFAYRYGLPRAFIEQTNIDIIWEETKSYAK